VHLTATDIARRTGGALARGDAGATVDSFTFDTRELVPGACFVALQGHRDGNDFVAEALTRGATAALVSRVDVSVPLHAGQAIIKVDDPLDALGTLAQSVRADRADLTVVGITGSSGKTSTKDLLHAALLTTGAVHANRDSFNNEVGLPITLLGVDAATRYVVTEMGARFAGNIAALCAIAQPSIGIVTNIGLAHAEHLGGADGIARVKSELIDALPPTGLAVLNADDAWSAWMAERSPCPVVTVGESPAADVRITDVRLHDDLRPRCRIGDFDIDIPLRGVHQVHNAAQAVTVARHLGVSAEDIAMGLAAAQGSRWRMELERSPIGVAVLNDAYNANPASMEAALRALAHLPVTGRRIAVLGEMRELGATSDDAHRAIGRLVAALGIDTLVGVGEGGATIAAAAAPVTTVLVDDAPAALREVAAHVRTGDAVLVKASRAVELQTVAEGLLATNTTNASIGSRSVAP
jgi:UDP-N-acetylmuramoyl-tripeptide--D-alanyl-D-alanine ligase